MYNILLLRNIHAKKCTIGEMLKDNNELRTAWQWVNKVDQDISVQCTANKAAAARGALHVVLVLSFWIKVWQLANVEEQ